MESVCKCGKTIYTGKMCYTCRYKEYRGSSYKNNTKRVKKSRRPNKSTCTLIVEHHEAMKDDPEHLTTEFIKKLIKVDCKDI